MNPEVVRQLRVKRERQVIILPGHHYFFVNGCQHLAGSPDFCDEWSTDEHRGERGAKPGDFHESLERFSLSAERVSLHLHIHGMEEPDVLPLLGEFLREQHTSSAGSHERECISFHSLKNHVIQP